MRIDKVKEMEAQKRKGSTGRTLVQVVWLLIAIGISYAFTEFLFAQEHLTKAMLYNRLLIPANVPLWAVKAGLIFIMVIAIQFAVFLGYVVANPRGRNRSGKASPYSSNKDPFDNPYGN
jgi:hypothetical protein